MNVHDLNGEKPTNQDSYKSLQLLDEIAKGEPVSQRDLSKKLDIALGLVNSYIKNLVSKGYVTIKNIPAKRYTYYLTPKGFSEKTRLTYQLLQDYTNIYREARRNFHALFHELSASGAKKVVFAGVDEVAEIAYITLQETGLKLVGVVDGETTGKEFFGMKVEPVSVIEKMNYDCVIITRYLKREKIYEALVSNGVDAEGIRFIFE